MSGARGGPGSVLEYQGEPWSGDPRTGAGLPRPIGWRVRQPDGSAAYDKATDPDTGWVPVGGGEGPGGGITSVNGDVGPAVAITLASVFAFGLAAPAADNVFDGPSYNAQFPLGGSFGFAFGTSLIEHAGGSAADPRTPGHITTRYYPTALTAGSACYDFFVAYDPTWGGVVGDLNDFNFRHLTAAFSNDPTPGTQTDLAWSDVAMGALELFIAEPYTLAGGIAAMAEKSLWNSFDLAPRKVQRLTGWGQLLGEIVAPYHGIIPQFMTYVRNDIRTAVVGDGTGWYVAEGGLAGGAQRGLFDLSLAVPKGDGPYDRWAWHFSVIDAGGTMTRIMTVGPDTVGVNGLAIGGGALVTDLDVAANGTQAATLGAVGPAGLTSLTPTEWIVVTIAGQKLAIPAFATT